MCFPEPPAVLDLESQLLEAAKAGDLEQVQRLLTAYPHIVNCRDLDGRSDLLKMLVNVHLYKA